MTLKLREDRPATAKERRALLARIAELEKALWDAIDTLEAMGFDGSALHGRLRAAMGDDHP